MVIPSIFIVGAPRCGTTSLAAYLASHPRVFVSRSKEPHHFGADLDIRVRPYADRRRYLELFEGAGSAQQAAEASVLYLYSKIAPREIREFNPSARIIIMVRDPVEMVCSLHAHNLLMGYENLPDLEQALAAEAERRQGRMTSSTCLVPSALQYSALGKYAEHVQRYQEVFGADRVKCILFDDLKEDPERTYRETLAFLGLEPEGSPDFKAHNERQRWRVQPVGRWTVATFSRAHALSARLPTRILRRSVLLTLGIAFYFLTRPNLGKVVAASRISTELRDALRQAFKEDVERLAGLLDRELSSWLQPEPPVLRGAASRDAQ